MKILDIHTHGLGPRPEAVISHGVKEIMSGMGTADPEGKAGGGALLEGQAYSVGVHPWETGEDIGEDVWKRVEELAALPQVVAIGECGVDATPKGGPMFRQLLVFKRQIELSERLRKPMIIHDVKGDDIIVGLRRDLKPTMPWAIHGFRKKPGVAEMLLKSGCWLSFGAEFNPDSLRSVPADRILAETDESQEPIEAIIARMEEAYGGKIAIAENSANFLGKQLD